jgi:hypothetical protein
MLNFMCFSLRSHILGQGALLAPALADQALQLRGRRGRGRGHDVLLRQHPLDDAGLPLDGLEEPAVDGDPTADVANNVNADK